MSALVKLALPTGRIQSNVFKLLNDAGVEIHGGPRSYRPAISLDGFEAKILKTQNIVEMLDIGRRDVGFAGADWVKELNADVVELLDTGMDGVRIVAAAPAGFPDAESYKGRQLIVATEYVKIAEEWVRAKGWDAKVIRSYGTTEAFPPEDADCIVDNTSSGATLEASKLYIIETLLRSSTRVFASKQAMDDPDKRAKIEDFVLILRSVMNARTRVMVEVNVSKEDLEAVASILPCMRQPTIAALHGDAGYVVKAAVQKSELPTLIPIIKQKGGTDIVVSTLSNVIP
ncbi:MAG: ATP phosphoribosyltransferase [Armatimonadetes bacterium]|nr:ATP phosphoribosyltransferase [Armatimonadota bacterium]MBS1726126.1 ATP phosphoribosyltransferase [Armatimonadota bacterium]